MLPTRGSPFEVDHGEGKLRGYVVFETPLATHCGRPLTDL